MKNGKDLLGSRFEDLTVKFYVGNQIYEGTVVPNRSQELGNNQFGVALKVPNTVPLGTSRIVLERKQNQIIDQSGTAPLYKEIHYDSNKIQLSQGAVERFFWGDGDTGCGKMTQCPIPINPSSINSKLYCWVSALRSGVAYRSKATARSKICTTHCK